MKKPCIILVTLLAALTILGSAQAQQSAASTAPQASPSAPQAPASSAQPSTPAAASQAKPAGAATSQATAAATASPQSSAATPKSAAASQAPAATAKKAPAAKPGQTPAKKTPAPLTLKTPRDKLSYAIGMNVGSAMKRDGIEVDTAVVLRAMKDVLSGSKLLLTDQEMQSTLVALQGDVRKRRELQMQQAAETNKKEGEAFLAANKTKEGIVTLPSGLQYKILEQGTGPKPDATDVVMVNYRGTLLNGTEFDSSYKRGQPASFGVGQVIKGWSEALQLMPVGSKWQVFIPPDLAYGARAAGPISPNSMLIFDVELVSIQPRPAPPAPPGMPAPAAAPATTSAPGATPAPAPAPTAAPKPPAPTPPPTSAPSPAPAPAPTPPPKPPEAPKPPATVAPPAAP